MSAAPATRAALLTPAGRGAVATIAVWGPHAAMAVDRWLQGRPGAAAHARSGDLLIARWGEPPSEELVVCRPPMENRCAADRFELHCHGGVAAVERILCDLQASGVERADARAWWDSQPLPPWRRLAGDMLSHARTERTAAILLDQFHGALDQALAEILAQLKSRDRAAIATLARLAELAPLGSRLVEPWRIALVGQPNAGKSSLLNALAGYQRAIVTATPGTTRDVVQWQSAIDGWPVVLSDTAGVRAATDAIEREGVARAIASAELADLVLLLVDASRGWTAADQELVERWPSALVVYSKCDLADPPRLPGGLATSATTGQGIDQLLAAVSQRLVPQLPEVGEAVPFTSRLGDQITAALADATQERWEAAARTIEALLVERYRC